jgi:TnpA family transposase
MFSAVSVMRSFRVRPGELRDRTAEAVAYCASGLKLVVIAIVLWNTTYLARTVQYVRPSARPG